jgi:4-hydroxy-3-methylbut-2-en-1-yl diphosphate synthase IspG/GcpE
MCHYVRDCDEPDENVSIYTEIVRLSRFRKDEVVEVECPGCGYYSRM